MRSSHFAVEFEKCHILRLSRHTFLLKPRILEPTNQSNYSLKNSASLPPGLVYIKHGRQRGERCAANHFKFECRAREDEPTAASSRLRPLNM